MKPENVVALIGGLAALLGCFLPFVSVSGGAHQDVGNIGGIALLLYALSGVIVLISLLALARRMRKVETWQIACGLLGLLVTGYVYVQIHGVVLETGGGAIWGAVLLFWGFLLALVDGLVCFGEHRGEAAHDGQ